MTLDGFLTFLTLMIAAYGVASNAVRLRLRLHAFTVFLVSVVGFALVIYCEMFAQYSFSCSGILRHVCSYLILNDKKFPTSGEAAFAVVMLWLLAAWLLLRRNVISPRALPVLRRLVDELFYERRFAEVIQVVEPHLPLLATVAARKLWSAQFYDWTKQWRSRETPFERLLRQATGPEQPPIARRKILNAFKFAVGTIGRLLPNGRSTQLAAEEILRVILLSRDIIEFIALYRPAFGVKLLGLPVREASEFSDAYLTSLIASPRSTLYSEVKNNQNYEHGTKYAFPEENRLLHFLFNDASQAKRLGVWRPLGEWVIARLRPAQHRDYTSSLNLSADAFDNECWDDPTFVVIQFFDLMVSAAEHQDVHWHMWLFYYPHILRRLLAIYSDKEPDVDIESERPTRAAYLIYAMFQAMRDWIIATTELPAGSSQGTLDSENVSHENNNIPKSAILALGSCLEDFLLAENVGERFKGTICDMVFSCIDRLPQSGKEGAFRRVLIASVVQGGPRLGPTEHRYGRELHKALSQTDYVVREKLQDFARALKEAYPT